MSFKKREINGDEIKIYVESSNIDNAVYNIKTKDLKIYFTKGYGYLYKDVPHKIFTRFKISESQGKYFHKEINNKFETEKL